MSEAKSRDQDVIEHFKEELPPYVITGKVSKDRLKYFIEVVGPENAAGLSKGNLLALLRRHLPHTKIDEHLLDDIVELLSKQKEAPLRRIAKGEEATPGRDGKLIFLLKNFDARASKDEWIDPRFAKQFDNVTPDMPVARLYPPGAGLPGKDVFGEVIPAPLGKEVKLTLDDTISLKPPEKGERFSALVSNTYGYLDTSGGAVSVREELAINQNIDFRVGDIEFVGRIKIRGDVAKGFSVKARSDITIQGTVSGGSLESLTGSVNVQGAVIADSTEGVVLSEQTSLSTLEYFNKKRRSTGSIFAHGSISAEIIDGAYLIAHGPISIKKEAKNSIIRTQETCHVQGSIFGGECFAVCGLEAGILGNPRETPTAIYLCSDIESSAEYASIQQKLKLHQEAAHLIEVYLGPYAESPEKIRKLKFDHRKRLEEMGKRLANLRSVIAQAETELTALKAGAKFNSALQVNFQKNIHKGVTICVGEICYEVTETRKGPGSLCFSPEDKQFTFSDLKPLICTVDSKEKKQ